MLVYFQARWRSIEEDEKLLKDPVEFTKALLKLKYDMDKMIEQSFKKDLSFHQALDKSFRKVMNLLEITPIFIASFCDHQFRGGINFQSEHEVEQGIDAVIHLFLYLENKDTFINAYSKYFS